MVRESIPQRSPLKIRFHNILFLKIDVYTDGWCASPCINTLNGSGRVDNPTRSWPELVWPDPRLTRFDPTRHVIRVTIPSKSNLIQMCLHRPDPWSKCVCPDPIRDPSKSDTNRPATRVYLTRPVMRVCLTWPDPWLVCDPNGVIGRGGSSRHLWERYRPSEILSANLRMSDLVRS